MENIFSIKTMPFSTTSLFSAYASFTATMMILRTIANDLVPLWVMSYFQSFFNRLITPKTNTLTVMIEDTGMIRNQLYDSTDIYLHTKLDPNTERLKASKTARQKKIQISIEPGEEIRDRYEGIDLKWRFVSVENESRGQEKSFFELSFNKIFKDRVMDEYLPFVIAKAKEIKANDRSIKLYTKNCGSFDNDEDGYRSGDWGFIYLDHPSNFDTLAMEPDAKKEIMDDLDRFLRRKEFYKKVGKAWKRGYLLYGPPGTGKSSLIAAMANYLKFDIYDLELASLYSDSDLRRVLVSTTNRSIMVIEDIDCSAETRDREQETTRDREQETAIFEHGYRPESKITLSGLLNFIDGLWSSCGDERIIIFTTNHKDRLDPALLRPGRMDVHIHLSYCTFNGFKLLGSNYLDINDHILYNEIEGLIAEVEVTPATIAEELMKNEDADVALQGVVDLLKQKKREIDSSGLEKEEVKKENTTVDELCEKQKEEEYNIISSTE